MKAYYNEFDPFAAQWLRNLINAGLIAPGDVDDRSITEVTPNDIKGYTQCHFFAGIGIWSHSLRQAGWRDDRHVWTGSCPCQPFSSSGRKTKFKDERHLWPVWYELIKKCKPTVIFGEQVSSKDALPWLDLVQDNLEASDYAFGALDICAAGVGAPHVRQRLFWVGDAVSIRLQTMHECNSHKERIEEEKAEKPKFGTGASNYLFDGLADSLSIRQPRERGEKQKGTSEHCEIDLFGFKTESSTSPVNGYWQDADWLFGIDGKWRPVEPGTFPLANGVAKRVGRLRAYGNAINAEVARLFIESYLDINQP